MSQIQTTCPYCGVGCGVNVVGGLPQGDAAHPANYGRLCSKGAALKDTLALPDRLTAPLLYGKEANWEEALDFIARRFMRIQEAHGPDAIAFYVSGQLLTEDYYVANKLMKGFIGSANIDTNSRLCMASAVAGHIRAFGEDVVPGCYDDFEQADLVVQVGSNMAWCHPVLYQRLMTARGKRGTRIVAIDPRRTATSETADLHLPIAAGTDIVLFNGLLVYLADAGALDHAWLDAHVSGFAEALEAARRSAPSIDAVAAATDLEPTDVSHFYTLFAQTKRTVTLYSQGVNQSRNGSDTVNAIINCHLATGRIGRNGMGPFSLTGQPNAMGGREVGGLANQLAAHMGFSAEDVDRVRRFWNAPHIASKPGYKAVDLFEAIAAGQIQAVWIAATNPAVSMPRAGHIREALARCPLVVVSDAWPTDTSKLAHVTLPAATWAEKDGTVTNSERRISRQRAFRSPPGLARPDWWMFAQVARRMGWKDAFSYTRPAEIFREYAALSAFENEHQRVFDIGAFADLDDAAYDAFLPTQWPCPRDGSKTTGRRHFAQGGFPTADGRARMISVGGNFDGKRVPGHLTLNTGRIRDQWHTMTRTGRAPNLMIHIGKPRLTLHPSDAVRLGIEEGGLARVESPHASILGRVTLDRAMRAGDAFMPMHWTDEFTSSGPVNLLVHAVTDPVSGQPDLKGTKIRISKVAEAWRGLLLRRRGARLCLGPGVHWSKVPVTAGFAFELSGSTPLAALVHSESVLKNLLQVSEAAEIISYADPKREAYRFAGISEGRLEACVIFAPPSADVPAAAEAASQLGSLIGPEARYSLLAQPFGCTSDIVCACFSVSKETICTMIRTRNLMTPEEIGGTLRAGTNCGSCVPELKKLLADVRLCAVA